MTKPQADTNPAKLLLKHYLLAFSLGMSITNAVFTIRSLIKLRDEFDAAREANQGKRPAK